MMFSCKIKWSSKVKYFDLINVIFRELENQADEWGKQDIIDTKKRKLKENVTIK